MKTSALFVATALAMTAGLVRSARAQECESDAECAEGEVCIYPPCAQPCDPDGETCEPVECAGTCVVDDQPFNEECASSDDCEDGWVCEVVGAIGCGGVVCPDGQECPEPEPCESEEIRACVPPPPAPCASSDDCEDGLVCVTYEYADCPPIARPDCPPGEECPEPEPVECATETESYCVPAYFAPCEESADCGTGFDCVEGEMCGCSAGGATGGGEPGDPGEGGGGGEEEPECFCEPTGELYCELQEMPCQESAECPDGFACELLARPSVPCSYDEETGETFCEEESGESEGQCVPEDWMNWYGDAAPAGSAEDYDEAVGGSLGGEAQAEGRADNFPDPQPNPDPGGGSGDGESGGCQVGGSSSGLALPVLGVIAVLLIGARRRWL